MKYAFLLVCALTGCDSSPTYEELVNYPSECSKADEQLKELRAIQRRKAFNPDPDMLTDAERAYNGRLKATIWWYAYRCGKS